MWGITAARVHQSRSPTGARNTSEDMKRYRVRGLAVRSCRLFNTALDFVFYDVPTLRKSLWHKDFSMVNPFRHSQRLLTK
jgi:hypothetical protein